MTNLKPTVAIYRNCTRILAQPLCEVSYLDAFMHNWANPQKFDNELSVPSDRHYEKPLFKNLPEVRIAPSTPPGGTDKNSTCKILRLTYAQLDQPTHVFPPPTSQSPWFHLRYKRYTYFIKDMSQLNIQKMKIIWNVPIDVFFYILVKLTITVAWSTCAQIKKLKLIYAQLNQPTP